MFTFTIAETQNLQSTREGVSAEFKSLTAAKRSATANQFYQGTTLKILEKNGDLVAYRNAGESWVNC